MTDRHRAQSTISNALQREADPDRLTAPHMGQLASLGAVVGSAIMFLIDPGGASAALLAAIGC